MINGSEISCRIERATQEMDADALGALLVEMYQPSAESDTPFDASIQLRDDYASVQARTGSDPFAGVNWANRICRAKRWVEYQRKTEGPFDGHAVVEDGDSWFQYPLLLTDTIDHLGTYDDIAVRSLSGSGQSLQNVAHKAEYRAALRKSQAQVLMLGAGGNDLLASGGLAALLRPWADGMSPAEALRTGRLDHAIASVVGHYRQILCDVAAHFPGVRVLAHGYDLPHPWPTGAHLGSAFEHKDIPLDAGRDVLKQIFDRLNAAIKALESEAPHFGFVDLQGVVDLGENSWFDELHPKDAGFGRIADIFRSQIARRARRTAPVVHLPNKLTRSMEPKAATTLARSKTFECGPGAVVVLDPGHGGDIPQAKTGGSSWNNAFGQQGMLEKSLTLDVAKRAKAVLEARGRTVVLTREANVNMSLAARARIASSRQADVFVSIHFNGSRGHKEQGTETFVHTSHTASSALLCRTIQKSMVKALGLPDRNAAYGGVRKARFSVINAKNHCRDTAAVLHEVNYLDRIQEEQKLASSTYRQKIAIALADGIDSYLAGELETALEYDLLEEFGDAIETNLADQSFVARALAVGAESYLIPGFAEDTPPCPVPHCGKAFLDLVQFDKELWEEVRIGDRFSDWLMASTRRSGIAHAPNIEPDHSVALADSSAFDVMSLLSSGGGFEDAARQFARYETAANGYDLAGFETFIRSLNLRYFVPGEFLELGSAYDNAPDLTGCGFPPRALWPNIAATAQMLDEIRHRLGARVKIRKCFDQNTDSRDLSQKAHSTFSAIDWHCASGTPEHWVQIAREVQLSAPRFQGGLGVQDGVVHIDT